MFWSNRSTSSFVQIFNFSESGCSHRNWPVWVSSLLISYPTHLWAIVINGSFSFMISYQTQCVLASSNYHGNIFRNQCIRISKKYFQWLVMDVFFWNFVLRENFDIFHQNIFQSHKFVWRSNKRRVGGRERKRRGRGRGRRNSRKSALDWFDFDFVGESVERIFSAKYFCVYFTEKLQCNFILIWRL